MSQLVNQHEWELMRQIFVEIFPYCEIKLEGLFGRQTVLESPYQASAKLEFGEGKYWAVECSFTGGLGGTAIFLVKASEAAALYQLAHPASAQVTPESSDVAEFCTVFGGDVANLLGTSILSRIAVNVRCADPTARQITAEEFAQETAESGELVCTQSTLRVGNPPISMFFVLRSRIASYARLVKGIHSVKKQSNLA